MATSVYFEDLQKNIEQTFDNLYRIVEKSNDSDFDKNPSENAWSIGQVVEHITKTVSGFDQLFSDKNVQEDRESDKKILAIKSVFLDYSTKYEAPEFVAPTSMEHDKNESLQKINQVKNELLLLANTRDLSLVPQDLELPSFGKFTRLEWLYFAIFHTQRHTEQIERTIIQLN